MQVTLKIARFLGQRFFAALRTTKKDEKVEILHLVQSDKKSERLGKQSDKNFSGW